MSRIRREFCEKNLYSVEFLWRTVQGEFSGRRQKLHNTIERKDEKVWTFVLGKQAFGEFGCGAPIYGEY